MDVSLKEQLVHSIMRLKHHSFALPPELGIRTGEFFVLSGIAGNSDCGEFSAHLSDIHNHLHVTKPAVSQTLNALEKKGLLYRDIDRNDRRKIAVTLTSEGQTVLDSTKKYIGREMDITLSRFGEDNARELIALLTRLADILEELNAEGIPTKKGENSLD